MPKTIIDLSGIGGLAPRYYKDHIFDTPNWQDRIIGNENMYADGIVTPFDRYGCVSPAHNTYEDITGSITDIAGSTLNYVGGYPPRRFLFDYGTTIWKIGSDNDTSLASKRVVTGATGTDLEIYTVNDVENLFYSYQKAGGGDIGIYDMSSTWDDTWLSATVANGFNLVADADHRMIVADNGFMYVLDGSNVHKIDGTSNGGTDGTAYGNVLSFPVTFTLVDGVDLGGVLWIALMRSQRDIYSGVNLADSCDSIFSGVYIWDRQSTKVNMRDFVKIDGVNQIRTIFSFRNTPWVFTVSTGGYVQLRAYNGSEFKIIRELGREEAPRFSDSVHVIDDYIMWITNNGYLMAYGKIDPSQEQDGIYKIGDITSEETNFQQAGAMVVHGGGSNGSAGWEHEAPSCIMTIDANGTHYAKRFRPFIAYEGGTVKFPHAGNFKSMVKLLPKLSRVKSVTLFYPKTNIDSSSTEVVDVDLFFDQSRTSWGTKTLTRDDGVRGYYHIPIGKNNVNSIQLGLTWKTNNGLTEQICPRYAEIEYEPTTKKK